MGPSTMLFILSQRNILAAIWHDIVGHISTYLGPNTFKAPDVWNFSCLDNLFHDPSGVKDSIHQYVIYCYALGDKTETAYGGKRLQLGFCFIFGVSVYFFYFTGSS